MSIYEVLLLAHLGSTAVLLGVLWVVIAAQKAFEVARGRPTGSEGHSPRPDVPAPSQQPQPAPTRAAAKDVLPHRGRSLLHPSS